VTGAEDDVGSVGDFERNRMKLHCVILSTLKMQAGTAAPACISLAGLGDYDLFRSTFVARHFLFQS
jgi:hypothetical protein